MIRRQVNVAHRLFDVAVTESLHQDGAAAYERQLIGIRTRQALAAKRRRGQRAGSVPYGYRVLDDGRTLALDDGEQAVIERVRALRLSGLSIRAIVDDCRLLSVTSRSGRPLTKTKVERILKMASTDRRSGSAAS